MCNKSELMAEWILSIYDSDFIDLKNDIILESPRKDSKGVHPRTQVIQSFTR